MTQPFTCAAWQTISYPEHIRALFDNPMTKTYEQFPEESPTTPLLDKIKSPADLRKLDEADLETLADELRAYMLYSVSQTGGHFGAGMGVVELTLALHYIYDTPTDRLVWDVGHQAYPHKILTGRRDFMHRMRQKDGLAGFPKRSESEYDTFGVGHSSTSISAALGMALSSKQRKDSRKHVAVIGDGAMTAGMAFEALNHAGSTDADMLVILNDNNMSISENVGALSTYFSRIWASRLYNNIRASGQKVLSKIPRASEFVRRTEEHVKGMLSPGTLFEEMGFNYIGPIDGHNIEILVETLRNLYHLKQPVLLHVVTQKGRGYKAAEEDPIKYHALSKIEPKSKKAKVVAKSGPKYQDVFGQWLCDMAAKDENLVAITPAMREGSGMVNYAKQFPDRYHDVAIAEQHAVTLGAGFACEGLKPIVAIYSTFLQRGYDQLIHDVALQNLDVTFALDRAGLVGEDGPSHAGAFDLSFLRCIPNMMVLAPSDENETRQALYTAYEHKGPSAVRYPRGGGPNVEIQEEMTAFDIGKGVIRREGREIAILSFGTVLADAMTAAESLDATVADMRFVKPIDQELILKLAETHSLLVTVEENAIAGGAGAAVLEYLSQTQCSIQTLCLGLPDHFQDQGSRNELLAEAGLDSKTILEEIDSVLNDMRVDNSANEV